MATKTALGPGDRVATLSKLTKCGEVKKAERGYRLASLATNSPPSPDAWHTWVGVLFTPRRRRYGGRVLPLGFRFDVDAVVISGVAHRRDCDQIKGAVADDAVHLLAGGVHRAQRCPRECPRCQPPFETLTHQLERRIAAPVR